MKERMLTGDRVTGKLHLGHYAGSLKNRVALQDRYEAFLLLADVQALTTHFDRPELIRDHLREVALDYLAAGIDPEKSTVFVQSMVPEIAELTVFYSMFVTVNVLRHNPTIKSESRNGSLDEMYYGFLGYPVSQAADITFCKATVVPVGDDQLPHLEFARKIVRRFNELYQPVLVEPKALLSDMPRLVGTDGSAKMSKSLGNAIPLDSSKEELAHNIRRAVTDPARIRKNDPGHPDVCPIYTYHRVFRPEGADEIREGCERGTMGCAGCKERVTEALERLLEPMRERRAYYAARPKRVDEMLIAGTNRARAIARETMAEVREAMSLNYF
ncbi:tryptophan--tRNA ligase [Paenibacillus thermoaerophilus]|uniref:Tryptophan--tRNA ligase n=1 Tax=Paenibacillus thermoaerophilus TaxID=1215385 RepID=A0ABW2UZH4_9BACL|nr:tryptophan--tRNA ligase [Paenibacillus thermoaerophilus]TMV14390.1 tryptophan--tRNA ligase [Paenibacillus thermoaerophilus]